MKKKITILLFLLFCGISYSQDYREIFKNKFLDNTQMFEDKGYKPAGMEQYGSNQVEMKFELNSDNGIDFIEYTLIYNSDESVERVAILTTSKEVYDAFYNLCTENAVKEDGYDDYDYVFKDTSYGFTFRALVYEGIDIFSVEIFNY